MTDGGGSVSKLIDVLRQHNARVLSILTSFNDAPPGFKRVSVRILSEEGIDALANEIAAMSGYNIVSQSLDDLSDLPTK
jgi:acetoin utilization protein AcuB